MPREQAKQGCKHVSFDTRPLSFLEINPPLKQQMALYFQWRWEHRRECATAILLNGVRLRRS